MTVPFYIGDKLVCYGDVKTVQELEDLWYGKSWAQRMWDANDEMRAADEARREANRQELIDCLPDSDEEFPVYFDSQGNEHGEY